MDTAPHPDDIVHIATPAEWAAAQAAGRVAPASLDIEGFVHCSTRAQLPGTLDRWFRGAGPLRILVLDPGRLDAELRWEESHPGALFPHVYGPLPLDAVVAVEEIRQAAG
ncbi:MAG TPA: DUF952 domain-containing protein [Acidimicrobiales bacterium]|nr:DUF952 domain-containing protein [Acidimicrobiales bacterium]